MRIEYFFKMIEKPETHIRAKAYRAKFLRFAINRLPEDAASGIEHKNPCAISRKITAPADHRAHTGNA